VSIEELLLTAAGMALVWVMVWALLENYLEDDNELK
jgi:hypothetical protein